MAAGTREHEDGRDARAMVTRMGEAVEAFLAALTPDQRARAVFPFDDQERYRWYYTPNPRQGIPLAAMERDQQRLAHRLAATGLSRTGYFTATAIIGLESTLDAVEGWSRAGRGRDPLLYYVSVFGRPGGHGPWGWRFEGHHISLNYTIVDGRIVAPTPTFFGSNPAETPLGTAGTLRPLGGVEDLARELVHLFDEGQRATATLSPVAPPDIVAGNRARVVEGALPLPTPVLSGTPNTPELEREAAATWRTMGLTATDLDGLRYSAAPKGLAAARMGTGQREVLDALLREYIGRMPDDLAEIELAALGHDGLDGVHFAWAGELERHRPHYYRLQGPRFLVEYDNTQDDANHVHTVWRDPEDDFGAWLLARHYAAHHHA
ncbi:MAG TPA: DUF3500 domain-containing protein [Thermomicrobiaceae bacterium]|nr:DUF3500 domain-containing protein [Thermomicrobiaceae bacterium]